MDEFLYKNYFKIIQQKKKTRGPCFGLEFLIFNLQLDDYQSETCVLN